MGTKVKVIYSGVTIQGTKPVCHIIIDGVTYDLETIRQVEQLVLDLRRSLDVLCDLGDKVTKGGE